jgi:hypothetical protein
MWLAIFEIPILPVKSMWFFCDPANSNNNSQAPLPLNRLYLPQIFSTLLRSAEIIALADGFLILLFTGIQLIVLNK